MPDISAEIQLRPTRIGFLVRPTDLASVRAIMRACTCLWGGTYNPIIPVFKRPPKEWKPGIYERFKGPAIAKRVCPILRAGRVCRSGSGLARRSGPCSTT